MLSWWQCCNLSDVNPLCFVVALSKELCRAYTHARQPYHTHTHTHTLCKDTHRRLHRAHTQTHIQWHTNYTCIHWHCMHRFTRKERESETCHPPVRSGNHFKVFLSVACATRPPCWTLENNHLNVSQSALLPSSITPFHPYICIIF